MRLALLHGMFHEVSIMRLSSFGSHRSSARFCVHASVASALVLLVTTTAAPLDRMLDAEHDLASRARDRGIRPALLDALCSDGIVFAPKPVNGRHAWPTRGGPAGEERTAPAFAEVSGDGDLGIVTGGWERASGARGTDGGAAGDFVRIWKATRDGWCVAADMEVAHPRSEGGIARITLERGPTHPKPRRERRRGGLGFGIGVFGHGSGFGVGVGGGDPYDEHQQIVAHAINTMMSAERAYAFDVRKEGSARAYARHAAPDVRFDREDVLPVVGITPAIPTLEREPRFVEWRPFGSGVATSADLGYSYGLAERRARSGARPDTSAYLHVWRRGANGRWQLAVDMECSVSEPL